MDIATLIKIVSFEKPDIRRVLIFAIGSYINRSDLAESAQLTLSIIDDIYKQLLNYPKEFGNIEGAYHFLEDLATNF